MLSLFWKQRNLHPSLTVIIYFVFPYCQKSKKDGVHFLFQFRLHLVLFHISWKYAFLLSWRSLISNGSLNAFFLSLFSMASLQNFTLLIKTFLITFFSINSVTTSHTSFLRFVIILCPCPQGTKCQVSVFTTIWFMTLKIKEESLPQPLPKNFSHPQIQSWNCQKTKFILRLFRWRGLKNYRGVGRIKGSKKKKKKWKEKIKKMVW